MPRCPRRNFIVVFGLAASLCGATQGRAETTALFLDSQGSLGPPEFFTPSDGTFGGRGYDGSAEVSFQAPSRALDLSFAANKDAPLVAGAYEDAQRWPLQSPTHPGLEVSGSCNTTSGRFVVYELMVGPGNSILRFAADFEQRCDGGVVVFGSVRINSNVSIEPRLAVGARRLIEGDSGFAEARFTVFLTHPAVGPVTVNYMTADGTALAGTDYIATGGTITFAPGESERIVPVAVPSNVTPQPDRDFSMELTAAVGAPVGQAIAAAVILDDDGGTTRLYLDSQPLEPIARGARRTLTILDGSFEATNYEGVGLRYASIRFLGGVEDWWTVYLAPPRGTVLVPGVYENAVAWNFQDSESPGLSVSGQGLGCSTLTGRFVVHEVVTDPDGNLQHFAADFEQHCEGFPAAFFGSIRINSTVPIVQQSPVAGDFNGDGKTDVLWRNNATGDNVAWFMNGPVLSGGAVLTPVSDSAWTVAGTADFNGDGETDILWRNAITGGNVVWFMADTTISGGAVLPSVADTNWQIAATGRFDGDAWPDIVWRNQATGENVVWFMQGTMLSGGAVLASVPDTNWKIVGAGDADADGNTDLFWRNAATGQSVVWFMNGGGSIINGAFLPAVADSDWMIGGVGDFNGDGRPDFLWRNASTGDNALWFMNGTRRTGFVFLPSVADTSWNIRGPK